MGMPESDLGPHGDHAHEMLDHHVHEKGYMVAANAVEEHTVENDAHGTVCCTQDVYPVKAL